VIKTGSVDERWPTNGKIKAVCPWLGREEAIRQDLRETETVWEGLKRGL